MPDYFRPCLSFFFRISMSAFLILDTASAISSTTFLLANRVNSSKEGSPRPNNRWITSEKLSSGRFSALSLHYAESSSEIVLLPMHQCMCICAFIYLSRIGTDSTNLLKESLFNGPLLTSGIRSQFNGSDSIETVRQDSLMDRAAESAFHRLT